MNDAARLLTTIILISYVAKCLLLCHFAFANPTCRILKELEDLLIITELHREDTVRHVLANEMFGLTIAYTSGQLFLNFLQETRRCAK